MTRDSVCSICGGELSQVPHRDDVVACTDCGAVNPPADAESASSTENADTYDDSGENELDSTRSLSDAIEIRDSSDENLVDLLASLDQASKTLDVSHSVQIRAAELAISAWENRLFHGRSKDAVVGACVYAATREKECPRPLTVVSGGTGVDEPTLNKSYRTVVSELDLELPVVGPAAYVQYIGEQLELSGSLVQSVESSLKTDTDLSGNPAGIAAAALYVEGNNAGYSLTLSEVGQVAGVAKETVWRKTQDVRQLKLR